MFFHLFAAPPEAFLAKEMEPRSCSWTLGVIISIAAHNPDPLGIDITLAAIATMGFAYSAIL